MNGNLLIAQSGGPTAAINATLSGILRVAAVTRQVKKVYGARNGIEGVLNEQFMDLQPLMKNVNVMRHLAYTPGAALGSCRYKLESDSREDSEKVIEIFRRYGITYFLYIGGNDSMDTVMKLDRYLKENHITDIHIIGAPKTIDNDLAGIDHTPGFGSAAKYIATTFAELERDIMVYDTPAITIVEVMGRNAGWLTAASSLARVNGGKGPDFIYLCEHPFHMESFLNDLGNKLSREKSLLIAVSEGIKNEDGEYISSSISKGGADMFGHSCIAGASKVLEESIRNEIGCKVRSIELNLMQRSAMHVASETDLSESEMLGMKALQLALEGRSGEMASLCRREKSGYEVAYTSVPIEYVANSERKVPQKWINGQGNDVEEKLIEYMYPLIQGEINLEYHNGIPHQLILSAESQELVERAP